MKILHILGYDEQKFNVPLVQMLLNKQLGFEDDFSFATNHKELYRAISKYGHAEYFEKGIAAYINEIYKSYDLIVIQGWNQSVPRASVLKKQAAEKIVWRFWGSDSFPFENETNLKRRLAGYLFFRRLCRRIAGFYAIGYAVKTDMTFLEKRFQLSRDTKGFSLPFRYNEGQGAEYKNIYEQCKNRKSDACRIMVGHSANERENHIVTLERLKKYKNENITVILVLSYGNDAYRRSVISKATEIFGEKVEIHLDMMPLNEYRKFLSGIDVFLIESLGSNALGNVTDLVYFGKKIFVRKDSFLDQYLTHEAADHFFVEDLENMDFDSFASRDFNAEKNHRLLSWKEDDEAGVKAHKMLYNTYRRERNNE